MCVCVGVCVCVCVCVCVFLSSRLKAKVGLKFSTFFPKINTKSAFRLPLNESEILLNQFASKNKIAIS